MKIAGIIVEYNPLHNGHIHHINETRRISNCDALVAVMSGNYTQRGEPSIINKFDKTKLALQFGVDLVVELPFVYSTQSADIFSFGAVSLLNSLGVNEIYFGSEDHNLDKFKEIHTLLKKEETQNSIKEHLKQGFSYPKSVSLSLGDENFLKPNNILGLQYMDAIEKVNKDIGIYPIERKNSNHLDEEVNESNIASATSIRKLILNKEDFSTYVAFDKGFTDDFLSWDKFKSHLFYKLKTMSLTDLEQIHQIKEGLHNKIFELSKNIISFEDLCDKLVSKRYTRSFINRVLLNIFLEIKKEDINKLNLKDGPEYTRILGMNSLGQKVLKSVDESVNIIQSLKDNRYLTSDIELKVSKVYSFFSNFQFEREFKHPIIIKEN